MNIEAASIFCIVFYTAILIFAYSKKKITEWLFVGLTFFIGAVISRHIYLNPHDIFWDGSNPDLLVSIIFGYSLAWFPAVFLYPVVTIALKEKQS